MENGDQPATKQDLVELRSELKGDMAAMREALVEAMHDTETRLLTAFYGWAQGTQKHLWDLDRAEISLRERLGGVDKRLMDLELRPPGGPSQADPPSA